MKVKARKNTARRDTGKYNGRPDESPGSRLLSDQEIHEQGVEDRFDSLDQHSLEGADLSNNPRIRIPSHPERSGKAITRKGIPTSAVAIFPRMIDSPDAEQYRGQEHPQHGLCFFRSFHLEGNVGKGSIDFGNPYAGKYPGLLLPHSRQFLQSVPG